MFFKNSKMSNTIILEELTMKKFLVMMLTMFILVLYSPAAFGNNPSVPKVEIDGVLAVFKNYPIIENGRVLVPVRSLFSTFGAQMIWKEDSREAVINKDGIEIILGIDKNWAKINGVEFYLDVPAQLIKDSTYLPLRFITQAFGYKVSWDQDNYLVSIMTVQEGRKENEVYGYYGFGSYSSLLANPEKLSTIATMWFILNGDGSIKTNYPKDYQSALDFCRQNGIKTNAVLFQNNSALLEQLLNSPENWDRVCLELTTILEKDSFDGINLDLEGIPNTLREEFLKFIAYLSKFIRAKGKTVLISLPPKTSDNQSWYTAYDYGELASLGDCFIVMAYDQHYSGSQPGPLAGIKWAEQVIKYTVSKINLEKLILSCGLYGYDWPEGERGSIVDHSDVEELKKKHGVNVFWDENHYSPYLQYTSAEGVEHIVWFENDKSIAGKISLINKYQLQGMALWRLGLIPESVWNTISNSFVPVKK